MRVEQYEKIYLSEKETEAWGEFEEILKELERECKNSDTLDLVSNIWSDLNDLWEMVWVE